MRKRDRKALWRYIRQVADQIGLYDWRIDLLDEPCDEDCNAQTRLVYGRKLAEIKVSEHFRGRDPKRIRITIVHELTHCHFSAANSQIEHDLSEHLGRPAADLFYSGWLRNFEYGIDAVAEALAPHIPLIDWPKGKGK